MKFGETLHQRSVPKWASYNLDYNQLKRLIKLRTTKGVAIPTPIPGSATSHWSELDQELFGILKEQYDNIGLFLRSKYGEIDRRLAYLERQVRSAQRSSSLQHGSRHLQARRYQKLVQEADQISEDIQSLVRFAAVQKTAFRKILKKYRKWTGGGTLQTRLDAEVFSDGQLQLNLTDLMQRLASQLSILTEQLQGPMLKDQASEADSKPKRLGSSISTTSAVRQISDSQSQGALWFDATFSHVPFGKAAGTATYWIHPDNLEEAKILLLRYSGKLSLCSVPSNNNSSSSLDSQISGSSNQKQDEVVNAMYFDNVQRFMQDHNSNKPSRVALSANWSSAREAVITLSDLARIAPSDEILRLKRKDLTGALDRDSPRRKDKDSPNTTSIRLIQDYLQKHRDVKPIVTVQSKRSRFAGSTNSTEVGNWATLDTDISFLKAKTDDMTVDRPEHESIETFPHAVLEFRWEFGHKPEVVHAFDNSYLAERINDFTIESAAIYSQSKEFRQPAWTETIKRDIRKIPVTRGSMSNRRELVIGTTSGQSSTDGAADSVFSAGPGQSTAPSEVSPSQSVEDATSISTLKKSTMPQPGRGRKKKARIHAESPVRPEVRYYSEYDDPDSELNRQETYAIYVDPDEHFPGTETVSKAFSSMYQTLQRGGSRVLSWLPLNDRAKAQDRRPASERTPLLFGVQPWQVSDEGDVSSDSDSTPTATINDGRESMKGYTSWKKAKQSRTAQGYRQRLSRRQREHEKTLFQFYTGLLSLSYVLLLMAGTLLATGRKKNAVPVDVGAIIGVTAAEVCAFLSGVLIFMRNEKLSIIHWGTTVVAIIGVVVIGIGLLASTVARLA